MEEHKMAQKEPKRILSLFHDKNGNKIKPVKTIDEKFVNSGKDIVLLQRMSTLSVFRQENK